MEELFEKLKNGDEEAFEEIVKIFKNKLLLIAKLRLNDDGLADDAVQETFVSLFLNVKKIKECSKLKAWITIVLINNCNNIIKKRKDLNFSYELDTFNYDVKSEDEFQNVNDNIDFIKFIEFLNVEERTIIAMYYSQNYTTKEISDILKLKESTVRSKMLRAKIKIREKLGGAV